jgi:hypothetical protein
MRGEELRQIFVLVLYAMFVAFVLYGMTACSTPNQLESLCVLRPKDGMCWVKKKEGIGQEILSLDGYYAVSENDARRLYQRINECAHKPQVSAASELFLPVGDHEEFLRSLRSSLHSPQLRADWHEANKELRALAPPPRAKTGKP